MGRASGAGSPVHFACPVARRNRNLTTWSLPEGHDVTLTGRTKPYTPPRAIGSRSTFTSREFRCTCGHVGWSNHAALERMEKRT